MLELPASDVPQEVWYSKNIYLKLLGSVKPLHHNNPLDTRCCCDVESTSRTMIQRRNKGLFSSGNVLIMSSNRYSGGRWSVLVRDKSMVIRLIHRYRDTIEGVQGHVKRLDVMLYSTYTPKRPLCRHGVQSLV